MKKILFIMPILFLIGCGNNYDKGYDDGWDADKNKILYSISEAYRNGYEDGWYECNMFNEGYHDAQYSCPPNESYKDDENYKLGYLEAGGEYYDY